MLLKLARWTLAACVTVMIGSRPVRADVAEVPLGSDLSLRAIAPGFWLHVSKDEKGIAANGLLAQLDDGLLLVDTPWTEAQTDRLLDYATTNIGPVVDAVVTHTHADRMGGLPALRRRGVRTRAIDLSVRLAAHAETGAPDLLFRASEGTYRDPRGFEVVYPGPGHTVDNTVVWFPKAHLLFGGCLVKAEQASELGYIKEGDLSAWPDSIKALRRRFRRIDMLVPGHGAVGGTAALERTLVLLRAAETQGTVFKDVPAKPDPHARYLFYVHGRILETEGRSAVSPDFGVYAYDRIVRGLAARGFVVISEVRRGDADDRFVDRLVRQIRQLRKARVPARNIGVIGASKGGVLTLRAATQLEDGDLSYVILAGCGEQTLRLSPQLHGHILSIYDRIDRFKPSCGPTFELARATLEHKEIVTDLGLDHGLLYTARPEWIDPTIEWLNRP